MNEELTIATKSLQQRASDSLSSFIQSKEWSGFFTATFKQPARYPRLAIDRIIRSLPSRTEAAFIAAEPHYLGNYHAHGLIRIPKDAYDDRDNGFWHWSYPESDFQSRLKNLGFSVYSSPHDIKSVSDYCSKYLTKTLCDYEFWGDWKH